MINDSSDFNFRNVNIQSQNTINQKSEVINRLIEVTIHFAFIRQILGRFPLTSEETHNLYLIASPNLTKIQIFKSSINTDIQRKWEMELQQSRDSSQFWKKESGESGVTELSRETLLPGRGSGFTSRMETKSRSLPDLNCPQCKVGLKTELFLSLYKEIQTPRFPYPLRQQINCSFPTFIKDKNFTS